MKQSLLKCPACGAPVAINEGESKIVCQYCGQTSILDAKFENHIGDRVSTTIQDSDSKTRQEIRQLQLTQELSMLQMQLSSLRTEKRALEREKSSKRRHHIKQVDAEEKILFIKITSLQNALADFSKEPGAVIQATSTTQSAVVGASDKSWGTGMFLACTLGFFGAHRYYVGKIGSALIQTVTFGGFGIWWIIDILTILSDGFTDSLGRPLNRNIKANRTLMKTIAIILIWIPFSSGFSESTSNTLPRLISSILSLLILIGIFNIGSIRRFITKKQKE